MKKKVYMEAVNSLGYWSYERSDSDVAVYSYPTDNTDYDPGWCILVHHNFDNDYSYSSIGTGNRSGDFKKLLKLTIDFAFTPIDEREDEEKFRVHLFSGSRGWLNYYTDDKNAIWADTLNETESVGAVFTESQYDKIRLLQIQSGFWFPKYDKDNTTIFVPVESESES